MSCLLYAIRAVHPIYAKYGLGLFDAQKNGFDFISDPFHSSNADINEFGLPRSQIVDELLS